ncbi:hypothetical protein T07_3682 [Trichinella nelsoni]|uniref:Uncharacterized protein n=1 Tax=Trichinella nelsoni TaxID=6336 RepID=A0A0V0RC65_9BILA|nr:hypothetical protein T07_3682 [Trichinella nelsoni]
MVQINSSIVNKKFKQDSKVHLQERMKNKPHEYTAVNSDPAKSENV